MEIEQDEQTEPNEMSANNANRTPLYIAIGAIIGGLLLLIVFAILLLREPGVDSGEVTPTPFPATTAASARENVLVVGITDSETISVAVDAPASLTLAGETFPVESQTVLADGIWSPNLTEDTRAVWVYGTVVNYVIGLRDSTRNRTLLQGLAPGDEMILRTGRGVTYAFAFDSRELVPTGTRDIYAQTMPGLTLILLGNESDERVVVHGRYVIGETAAGFDQGGGPELVELGETAQLGNTQLTVTGASYLYDRPEAPAGFAFYLVDFELQNLGQNSFDTSSLNLTLIDEAGNQYALNPVASQLGNNPRLPASLSPAQTVQATVGYQVPSGLDSATIRWRVTRADDGSQLQVNIPFSGGQTLQAGVSLEEAEVSQDGTTLRLIGQVSNLGDQSLVVTENDVGLTSDGTVYLITSVNPGFPWVLSANQTQPFSVSFQRPAADSATFQILNQPFRLDGLR